MNVIKNSNNVKNYSLMHGKMNDYYIELNKKGIMLFSWEIFLRVRTFEFSTGSTRYGARRIPDPGCFKKMLLLKKIFLNFNSASLKVLSFQISHIVFSSSNIVYVGCGRDSIRRSFLTGRNPLISQDRVHFIHEPPETNACRGRSDAIDVVI
jgi:hypothetical protein